MNGLVMAVRRGRIDLELVARFARDLAALPIRIEPPHAPAGWDSVIRVATKHQLTVYDAAYLELAERTRLPLSTAICERRAGRRRCSVRNMSPTDTSLEDYAFNLMLSKEAPLADRAGITKQLREPGCPACGISRPVYQTFARRFPRAPQMPPLHG